MNVNIFHFLMIVFRRLIQFLSQWFETVKKIDSPPDFLTKQYIEQNTQKMVVLMKNADEKLNGNISEIIYDKERFKNMMKHDNDVESHWKHNIMFETTHREDGKMIFVIMYYDLFKQGFAYYSDESYVSHKILNAIAMKYVKTFFCKDFFLDESFIEEHGIDYKSPLFEVFSDKETKKKKDNHSHVFAKLQGARNKKPDDVKKESQRNKFIHMGKTYNFSMLSKPKAEPVIPSKYDLLPSDFRLSYKNYKNHITD